MLKPFGGELVQKLIFLHFCHCVGPVSCLVGETKVKHVDFHRVPPQCQ